MDGAHVFTFSAFAIGISSRALIPDSANGTSASTSIADVDPCVRQCRFGSETGCLSSGKPLPISTRQPTSEASSGFAASGQFAEVAKLACLIVIGFRLNPV